jgi:MOSC domain-containing protein YiiM
MDVEKRKSVYTEIRTPERPGFSKSLYRVLKPGHFREGRKLIWIKDHNSLKPV